MACERNRILELKDYLSSLGISINVGKNKARGHKGIFMQRSDNYRIDISKNLEDEDVLPVLLHEFGHFVHYSYDKKLSSLNFAFDELSDEIKEELIKVTVEEIPKDFAQSLYAQKDYLQEQIRLLTKQIKQYYPNFKITDKNDSIEKNLSLPLKYLTKYDKIKYLNKIYSIDKLDTDYNIKEPEKLYIKIKSAQRKIKRINSRISRLNKYYNTPSELFARFISSYYTKPELTHKIAPKSCEIFNKKNIRILEPISKILGNTL